MLLLLLLSHRIIGYVSFSSCSFGFSIILFLDDISPFSIFTIRSKYPFTIYGFDELNEKSWMHVIRSDNINDQHMFTIISSKHETSIFHDCKQVSLPHNFSTNSIFSYLKLQEYSCISLFLIFIYLFFLDIISIIELHDRTSSPDFLIPIVSSANLYFSFFATSDTDCDVMFILRGEHALTNEPRSELLKIKGSRIEKNYRHWKRIRGVLKRVDEGNMMIRKVDDGTITFTNSSCYIINLRLSNEDGPIEVKFIPVDTNIKKREIV